MPKHSPRLFGFTLIELLVVISIIGIMLAIGAASFSAAQKGARDARRRAEMKAVQVALEQHYAAYGSYVTGGGSASGCGSTGATTSLTIQSAGGGPDTTVNDPAGLSSYTCTSIAASAGVDASFCACAKLEIVGRGNQNTVAPIPSTSCDSTTEALTGSGDYFCVESSL